MFKLTFRFEIPLFFDFLLKFMYFIFSLLDSLFDIFTDSSKSEFDRFFASANHNSFDIQLLKLYIDSDFEYFKIIIYLGIPSLHLKPCIILRVLFGIVLA